MTEIVLLCAILRNCSVETGYFEHVARRYTDISSQGARKLRTLGAGCRYMICCTAVTCGCQELVVARVL